MVKHATIFLGLALLSVVYEVVPAPPRVFQLNQRYPNRNEIDVCGNIRDVIRRNSGRFRKILVRNTNNDIVFLDCDDCRRMTARAKSKLDVLASRVMNRWGNNVRLKVIFAWTDQVTQPNLLHYEGRAVRLQTSDGDKAKLGVLAGLAAESGFDWVHYSSRNYIHASVFRDVCQTSVDLAFILDESGSVGDYNFGRVKRFVKNIVDFFNIGVSGTHVSLTTFGTGARTEFHFKSYYTKTAIKAAIDRVYYQGGWTYTADALIHVRRAVFITYQGMRLDPGIPKVAVLLTDGHSNGRRVNEPAQALRDKGVNVFCVGVGDYNLVELKEIASDPDVDHVFELNSFSDLAGWVDKLSAVSCDEGSVISSCDDTITSVESDMFKYFRIQFSVLTGTAIDIELKDIQGVSHLYASLTSKNPGPVDRWSKKNESNESPRALSLQPGASKLVYVSVQGQENVNKFSLSIWDALFKSGTYVPRVKEEQSPSLYVITVKSEYGQQYRYTITEGNEQKHFTINPTTAKITTTQQLDRETRASYRLRVVAQDINNRCHKGRTDIIVIVEDINDNAPEFTKKQYQATIQEGRSKGSFVAKVTATDKDTGVNAQLGYTIYRGNSPQRFAINSNGEVTTAAVLDFEEKGSYKLTINATDGGSPGKSATTVLNVVVQNVNELPAFSRPCAKTNTCEMGVKENEKVSTPVGFQLQATDPDKVPVCSLKYKIKTEQSQTNVFKISNDGRISTLRVLDREGRSQYMVLVTVEDCGRPSLRVQTRVKIMVDDENDNDPFFALQQYHASLFESAAVRSVVTQVAASDADIGNNAKIQYSLSGPDARKFVIDTSGTIKTKEVLDREDKESYTFNVIAKDGGTPPRTGSTSVVITILDVNDNTPAFGKSVYTANVPESEQVRRTVASVTATDKDKGVNADLVFSIVKGNEENTFSIDRRTGDVSLIHKLDYETKTSYSLTIKVTDKGSPPMMSTAQLKITVDDVNDNSPVFSPSTYRAVVKENARGDTSVSKVSAKDLDSGNNGKVNYFIYQGDDSDTFSLDKTTGQLSVKTPPDFEKKDRYDIGVEVRDNGNPKKSAKTTVTVFVEDMNDFTPTFTKKNYQFNVSEAKPTGDLVAKVTASDSDSGPRGQVVYTIESGNVGTVFSMDSNTGELRIKSSLDREKRSSYTLTLKARDGGAPPKSSTTKVQVTITDVNDNKPLFDKISYNFDILEDADVNDLVGKVTATDKDEGQNAQINYQIQDSKDAKSFSLDTSSGKITLAKSVDRETQSSYVFKVTAKDQGTPSLSSTVDIKVTILDVNDNAPRFPKAQYDCSVAENLAADIAVCYVTAVDPDIGPNGLLVYSIPDGNPGNAFRIDSNTGEIKTTTTLDRENIAVYRLNVTVKDGLTLRAGPSFQASTIAVIRIIDENDNEPKFTKNPYKFEVSENVAVNKVIGSAVSAVDIDEGTNGQVTYSLTAGNVGSSFTINSQGLISVNSKLDREKQAKFTLTVAAKDGGKPPRMTTSIAMVTVKDVNDNGPEFSQPVFSGSIREDASAGSTVLQVKAYDKDAGDNGKLRLKLEGTGTTNFSIDSNGFVYSKTSLDYETKSSYDMKVVAEDGGNPSRDSSAQVKITIINVNDNAPVFQKTSEATKVREDVAMGTQVIRMNATDSDNNKLSFKITKGNTGGAFGIADATGLITVAAKLDREKVVNYTLLIQATDTGGLSVWNNASIQVTDANDNAPVFAPRKYTATISENRGSGQQLVTVTAKDKDEGSNADITFDIFTGDKTKFHIDPKSGAVSTKLSLDREQFESYLLVISAKDNGNPSLSTTAKLNITVLDENDNIPHFSSNYAVSVLENTATGGIILRVEASDPDEGNNGRVRYSITSGNADGAFEVDQSSGSVSLKKKLDRETTGVYKLVITASDSASTPRSSTVVVDVTVGDENDNAPAFVGLPNKFTVTENSRRGAEVGRVQATDADNGANGKVSFSIVKGNDAGAFDVDNNSGRISVNGPIDREQISKYVLRIRATDNGSPSLNTEKDFNVSVTDVNDNAPIFTSKKFIGEVKENVQAGKSVVTITAMDGDVGINATVIYSITDGNSARLFAIDSASGLITTTASIDYETNASFNLTVMASDSVHNTRAPLLIEVVNVNDNKPTFTAAPYSAKVRENLVALAPVLRVSANDVDSFGQLLYSIEPGSHSNAFSIDPISGNITTADILDREVIDRYLFKVKVTDAGGPALSNVAMVTVDVSDANDNSPVFPSSSFTVAVSEDVGVGEVVINLNATDADIGANGRIKYTLVSSNPGDAFVIEPSTGKLKTKTALDRETISSYVLFCQASDEGTQSLVSNQVAVHVTVSDINDNSPIFSVDSHVANVTEGVAVGTVVKEVIATDIDAGRNGDVEYTIESGNQDGVFNIGNTNGVLTLAKEVDREVRSTYMLVIAATDHGVPARQSTVDLRVNILDINDNAPRLNRSSLVGSILENEPHVTSVMRIEAKDDDLGKNGEIVFKFIANENTNLFSLNSRTGEIFTKKSLDREQQDQYTLKISVSDGGSPQLTSFADVIINVIDVDDNCPKFYPAEYNVTVGENLDFGTSIVQVSASDVDIVANERILYAIRSGNTGGTFLINITSGVLYVGTSIDRELTDNYKIIVRAGPENCGVNTTDSGVDIEGGDDRLTSAVAVVNVQVTDVNDNPPDFTQSSYAYTFNDIDITTMFRIQATDKDLGLGGVVKFKLDDQKESEGKRLVTVEAFDQGTPSKSKSIDVVVTTEINCEAMVFEVSENGTISTQTLCSFVKIPEKKATLKLGDKHQMSCSAKGNTKPEYRWMKDGRFVSNWSPSGDYVINSATEDDEGGYACLASSAAGVIQSRLAQVIVNARPRIVKQPENATVQLGQTVALHCESSGDPSPEYQWYKNGLKMAEASGIKPKLPELVLNDAVAEDDALYFCEASNIAGSVRSNTVSLQVYGRNALVSMQLSLNKPNLAKRCHMFVKGDLKKLLDSVLGANVVFTNISAPGMCEEHPCNSNPCLHGGQCQEGDTGGYKCLCKPGWSGDDCETDVDECFGDPCFSNGTCTNRDGSYECVCSSSTTGKNCELTANACTPGRCKKDEVCVLHENTNSGFECVKKEFEIVMVLGEDLGKDKVKWFDLEKEIESLIRAIPSKDNENTKVKSRRVRSTTVDYGACSVRITSVENREVTFVLLCPANIQGSMEPKVLQDFVCGLIFTSGKSSSCGTDAAMMTPLPPTTYSPMAPLTVELKFFAKEEGSRKSIDAKEVVDRMESKEAKDMLQEEGFTMNRVAMVHPQPLTDERKTPLGLIVGMVLGLLVLVVLAVVVVIVVMKRRNKGKSFKALMQDSSVLSRRGSKENILQRGSSVKKISRSDKHYLNAVYDADYRDASDEESNDCMVQVNLGAKWKTKQIPPEVQNAPWYYENLTKDEAEDMMGAHVNPGSFLVRKGTTNQEVLILSIKAPEGGPSFRHLVIRYTGNGSFKTQFGSLEEKEFSSIDDVIEYFKVTPIKFEEDSPDVVLTLPWKGNDVLV